MEKKPTQTMVSSGASNSFVPGHLQEDAVSIVPCSKLLCHCKQAFSRPFAGVEMKSFSLTDAAFDI
jgi:hypothetical protein